YAYVGAFQNFIRVSRDGGKTWEEFLPNIHTAATVTGLAVVSTGMKAAPRVYAMVWTTNGSGIFRSDDYGHTFKPFANNLQLVVEGRADDSLLYGLSGDVFVKTSDGGQDWAVVESARFLYQPLYRTKGNHLTTVKQSINDPQGPTASVIEQIESDPFDPTI